MTHNSSIHDRLKTIFEQLNLTTYQIAKVLDENSSKFYNIMNGKAKPSYDTIIKLIDYYPQINPAYLFKGIQPVLLQHVEQASFTNILEYEEVPYIPIKFHATFVESNGLTVQTNELERFPVLKSSLKNKKNAVVIEIQGNSMTPTLHSGNKVLATAISESDWGYISGGVYAVIYRDFFVVKRIKDNELLTKNSLTLHSDNPKSGNISIAQDDIRSIWKITNIIEATVE